MRSDSASVDLANFCRIFNEYIVAIGKARGGGEGYKKKSDFSFENLLRHGWGEEGTLFTVSLT